MSSQQSSAKPLNIKKSLTAKTLIHGFTGVSPLEKTLPHKPRFILSTVKSLLPLFICLLVACEGMLWASTTGSISGTLKDPTGAVIAGATVQAINIAQGVHNKIESDANGSFIFSSLPVGHYDLQIEASGFKIEKRTGLAIDADTVLKID